MIGANHIFHDIMFSIGEIQTKICNILAIKRVFYRPNSVERCIHLDFGSEGSIVVINSCLAYEVWYTLCMVYSLVSNESWTSPLKISKTERLFNLEYYVGVNF